MKLSQIEKRIPQTLTNSKNIIQTDREYARRSSRARSTRGQENEAWALYKKKSSRESWGDLSGHRYIICPKPPYPAEKILNRRQLFFLAVPPWPVIKRLCPSRTIFSAWRWSSESVDLAIIILSHTNTVILLEPYCGTITEPGWPVLAHDRPIQPRPQGAFCEQFKLVTNAQESKNI